MGQPEMTTVMLHGQPLELRVAGSGRPILFLPAGLWLASDAAFVGDLARLGRVTAPVYPGFGATPAPNHLHSADDLSYLYLDLVEHMLSSDTSAYGVVVVGASLGAFIALQMAVKSSARISGLALVGPTGVKAGGREARDYVDLFAHTDAELCELAFTDANRFRVDLPELPEAAVTERVRARESLARYVWQPYMHDPKLAGRLHRIAAPTLVLRGAADRIVAPACADLLASKVAGARLEAIAGAGHLPHVEQPAATLGSLEKFIRSLPAVTR
jgi:pimeloyl-ACP methyl ester carboxylesterase